MKAADAISFFHGKERFNCAQAVLKAFQPESGVSNEAINAAASAGGGKALGGVCGALYVARVLLDDQGLFKDVSDRFSRKAGSVQCMQIRMMRQMPCLECVSLSAKLLEEHIDRFRPDDEDFRCSLQVREHALLPMDVANRNLENAGNKKTSVLIDGCKSLRR